MAEQRNRAIVQQIASHPDNRECVDCGAAPTSWCSLNLSVFVCIQCSGIHRQLGTHISQVRSLTLDKFTTEQVEGLKANTNRNFNLRYEAKLWETPSTPQPAQQQQQQARPRTIGGAQQSQRQTGPTFAPSSLNTSGVMGLSKITPSASDKERTAFIFNKYQNKRFLDGSVSLPPLPNVLAPKSSQPSTPTQASGMRSPNTPVFVQRQQQQQQAQQQQQQQQQQQVNNAIFGPGSAPTVRLEDFMGPASPTHTPQQTPQNAAPAGAGKLRLQIKKVTPSASGPQSQATPLQLTTSPSNPHMHTAPQPQHHHTPSQSGTQDLMFAVLQNLDSYSSSTPQPNSNSTNNNNINMLSPNATQYSMQTNGNMTNDDHSNNALHVMNLASPTPSNQSQNPSTAGSTTQSNTLQIKPRFQIKKKGQVDAPGSGDLLSNGNSQQNNHLSPQQDDFFSALNNLSLDEPTSQTNNTTTNNLNEDDDGGGAFDFMGGDDDEVLLPGGDDVRQNEEDDIFGDLVQHSSCSGEIPLYSIEEQESIGNIPQETKCTPSLADENNTDADPGFSFLDNTDDTMQNNDLISNQNADMGDSSLKTQEDTAFGFMMSGDEAVENNSELNFIEDTPPAAPTNPPPAQNDPIQIMPTVISEDVVDEGEIDAEADTGLWDMNFFGD